MQDINILFGGGGKKKEGVLKNNVNPCISGLESRNEEEVGK